MFKNLILYQIGSGWPQSAAELEQGLAQEPFAPCSATQEKSTGWLPARGQAHGALVEVVDGQWLARFAVETKSVPTRVINEKAQAKADSIEQTSGYKPGRKEMHDLRDEAMFALLPHAFPCRKELMVWVDPAERILAIDAGTQGAADEVITAITRVAKAGWSIVIPVTKISPQAAMTGWLLSACAGESMPNDLHIERNCELRGEGDSPARVRFDCHPIETQEVRQHIAEGKLPVRLAMGWQGRCFFTLTDKMHLKRIKLDIADDIDFDKGVDKFDADVTLFTGEMRNTLPALFAAMGGIYGGEE